MHFYMKCVAYVKSLTAYCYISDGQPITRAPEQAQHRISVGTSVGQVMNLPQVIIISGTLLATLSQRMRGEWPMFISYSVKESMNKLGKLGTD